MTTFDMKIIFLPTSNPSRIFNVPDKGMTYNKDINYYKHYLDNYEEDVIIENNYGYQQAYIVVPDVPLEPIIWYISSGKLHSLTQELSKHYRNGIIDRVIASTEPLLKNFNDSSLFHDAMNHNNFSDNHLPKINNYLLKHLINNLTK